MVVAHSQPSTSTPPKKNRRSIAKKKHARIAQEVPEAAMADEQEPATPQNAAPEDANTGDDDLMIDTDAPDVSNQTAAPVFPPLPAGAGDGPLKSETRRVPIPPHRMTPLKKEWINVFGPLTEMLGLQVRMNVQRRCVEMRVRAIRQFD